MELKFIGKVDDKRTKGFLILIFTVIILLTIMNARNFLTGRNFQSMVFQIPEFGILALAMTLAILTGGIDLSLLQTTILSGVLAGKSFSLFIVAGQYDQKGTAVLVAVVIAVGSAAVLGLINGLFIGYLRLAPILVTLGTGQLYLGIATVITKGGAVTHYPDNFVHLGSGTFLGIPFVFIFFIILAIGCSLLLNRTKLGYNIYMTGTNQKVAAFSGINTKKVLMITYMITGILAGFAAIIVMARTNSIKVGYGSSYLLLTVLIAVLGGVNPNGGFGKISGVVLAIVLLQLISSGFNIFGFSSFSRNAVWGAMLILVVTVNYFITQRN